MKTREIFRRGIFVLVSITVLGGAGCAGTRADDRRALLEAYLDSPIPEEKYDLAEKVLEAEITEALVVEEIPANPPAKFEITPYLYVLFVSPRKEARCLGCEYFFRELTPEEITETEREASWTNERIRFGTWIGLFGTPIRILQRSAVVLRAGGLATDPPQIVPCSTVAIVWIAAHEWGHRHLDQYPFGRNYGASPEMIMLNEIVANIIGEKITKTIVQKYGWEIPVEYKSICDREELRLIRINVDRLLVEGKIEEAEAYMEEMRLALCTKDWCPHKLNQAFFAACEPYGGGAEGDNPIPKMLRDLRTQYPSLKEFLEEIREVSSYEDFLSLLEEKEVSYPEG